MFALRVSKFGFLTERVNKLHINRKVTMILTVLNESACF